MVKKNMEMEIKAYLRAFISIFLCPAVMAHYAIFRVSNRYQSRKIP